MRKLNNAHFRANHFIKKMSIFFLLISSFYVTDISGQCTPQANTISGYVFMDSNTDGEFTNADAARGGVLVTASDQNGNVAGSSITDAQGAYSISSLNDGETYRVVFSSGGNEFTSVSGQDNGSSVQLVGAPACNVSYGLTNTQSSCGSNPDIGLTCFVQGSTEDPDLAPMATIIQLESQFKPTSTVDVIATHGETGSVWGLTYDGIHNKYYSSAFVKQYAGLKNTPYSIYVTEADNKVTTEFVNVSDLVNLPLAGIPAGIGITDCNYGNYVGRVGLGNLIISDDYQYLYVTLLDENMVVKISLEDPKPETTETFSIPAPANMDAGEEYRIFALKEKDGIIYIGGTVTASVSKNKAKSAAVITTLDPVNGNLEQIFETTYIKGFWQDTTPGSLATSHWLTDLDFTDSGEIMISLTDRLGHRYCKAGNNRVDQQYPDLLMVYFDQASQKWTLESNGTIYPGTPEQRIGSGKDNAEGPGNGEFFGFDFWPTNPTYHNETALGSVFAIPGTNEVIAAVYDPMINSYSGGIHRYNTLDGSKVGVKELYSHTIYPVFGKATGFGDIVSKCAAPRIEIGNLVWEDLNGNGLQDGGESGISGITMNLYNADCELIGTTTTSTNGTYYFNDTNVDWNNDGNFDGVLPNTLYYVEVDHTLYSEVSGLYTINSNEYTICTADAGTESDDLFDCDAVYDVNNCNASPLITVNTGSTNHSFDIGLGAPAGFDLALKKEIIGNKFAKVGQEITFMISVYNQGGVSASLFDVVDHIPSGFTFNAADNPAWSVYGNMLKTTFDQVLLPGQNASKILRLTVNNAVNADYTNIAEISSALDLAGNPVTDIDSYPDEDPSNDSGGQVFTDTDDQLNGNGIDDEDDSDPATPFIFDLAIKITLEDQRIYYADEIVKFDVTLYNQGNVDADHVKIVDYFPSGLIVREDLNPDWKYENGELSLIDDEILPAGASKTYEIYFQINKDAPVASLLETSEEFVNYVEIAESSPVGDEGSFDFDSTPDAEQGNDMGGTINTDSDNEVNDHGVMDEDDHDPVYVRTVSVDLALIKTVNKKSVKAGGDVTFNIVVINQGSAPIQSFTVVDYIPENMSLNDENWEMIDAQKASKTVTLDDPLFTTESYKAQITLKVAEGIEPQSFINYAEIMWAADPNGISVGDKDIDSSPDSDQLNDQGGMPGSNLDDYVDGLANVDEDDHDPAQISMYEVAVVNSECLSNATNSTNGQFEDEFEIVGPSGAQWYILTQNNYYSASSPEPPAAPTALATGTMALLDEVSIGNGMSMYSLIAIRIDGQEATIAFRNNDGDVETLTQGPSNYNDIFITGDLAICNGSVGSYVVENATPGVEYDFDLPDGGMIIDLTDNTVTVDWSGLQVNESYDLVVSSDDQCQAPTTVSVANGASGGSMSCLANINISMNATCEMIIDADLVLTSNNPNAAYSVMLLDNTGEVIPNATLTSEHVGQTVTAKIIDACSGNSCWSEITVEDKLKPTIICEDAIVPCNKVDQFVGPIVEDNCSDEIEITMLGETITPLVCDSLYVAEIERSYQATDEYGRKSDVCTMTIFVERVDLDSIEFPSNFVMVNSTALTCGGYDLDENGNPAVSVTGVPEYNNEEVYPSFEALCNTAITYEDKVREINGIIKITRTWTVWEWSCSTTLTREYEQYIEITDTDPPMITCPADITASATGVNCEAIVTLPLPTATDDCADDITIQITTPYGLIEEGDSRVVAFPFGGPYSVLYKATDPAGNSSICEMQVTVIDNVAPVAICDQNDVVGLNSQGEAYYYAFDLDGGSFDACGIDFIDMRRVDSLGNSTDPYTEKVLFTCEDVGELNMVELRVTDLMGLSNSCMVNIIVQDKQAPVVSGPADVTLDCGADYLPLSQFGEFTYNDACEVVVTTDSIISLDACGQGTITRIYTASDKDGSSTATQTITIINDDVLSVADDMVVWPANLDTIGDCTATNFHPSLLPDGFGYPSFVDDGICEMMAAAFDDAIYTIDGQGSCYKIVRTWTIIDYCHFNDPGYEDLTHQQIIKVSNLDAPEITLVPIDTIITTECDSAQVSLSASAVDCSPASELDWVVNIDYFQDFNTTTVYDYTDSGAGDVATVMGQLPLGTHNVIWTFIDPCGNISTQSQEVTILNLTAPVVSCLSKTTLAIGPMDLDNDGEIDTEMGCIIADSLDASSYHPCNIPFEFSFSPDSIVKEMCFDCGNLGTNLITLYAIDALGNVSSCMDTVIVEDNNDVEFCINPKDCISAITDTTLSLTEDCVFTMMSDALDIDILNDECGEITITHDFEGAPSDTTLLGAQFPLGTTIVTWTVSNEMVSIPCELIVTVIDEINPIITCAADDTFSAQGDMCEFTVVGDILDAIGSDNCTDFELYHDYSSAPDSTTLDGAVFPTGTTTVTWTIIDAAGLSATCEVDVTVVDDEAPLITCAIDASIFDTEDNEEGCSHTVADDGFDAVATDLCDGIIIPTHDYDAAPSNTTLAGAEFEIGSTIVTWTATDASGNSATCTVEITVVDNVDPTIECLDDTTIATNDIPDNECQYIVPDGSLDIVGDDNCDNVATTHNIFGAVSATSLEGATFPLGTTQIIWTVTDLVGNTATCETSVTVVDNTPPVCEEQDTMTIAIDGSLIYTFDETILSNPIIDNCDSDLTYSFDPAFVDCDNVSDTLTVTVTSTDDAGNSTDCDVVVIVEEMGMVECNPIDITVNLDENGQVTITPDQVNDAGTTMCGQEVDVMIDQSMFDCDDIATNPNPVTITVIGAGDTTTCVAFVTVLDEFNPSITCAPDPIAGDSDDGDFNCSHIVGNNGFDPIITTDNCDGFTVTHNFGSAPDNTTLEGAEFPLGITEVIWTITDASGNLSTCDLSVTVIDDIDPICVEQDTAFLVIDTTGMIVLDTSILSTPITDNCDDDLTITFDPAVITCDDAADPVTVTVTATDDAGNSTTCEVVVVIIEEQELICDPMDITVNLDENGQITITPDQIVNTNISTCGQAPQVSLSQSTFFCNDQGVNGVDITITNNTDTITCFANVTVVDTIFGPQVMCAVDVDLSCTDFENDFNGDINALVEVTEVINIIDDNCLVAPDSYNDEYLIDTVVVFDLNACNYGTVTTTVTVTDDNGMSSSCTQTISVQGPQDSLTQEEVNNIVPDTVMINDCITPEDLDIDQISILDLIGLAECGEYTLTFTDTQTEDECPYVIERVYTIEAICQDQTFTFTQIIIVQDDTAPVIEMIEDIEIYISDEPCIAIYSLESDVVATDNCTDPTITYSYPGSGGELPIDSVLFLEVGEYNFTVTATDNCQNFATQDFLITVQDTAELMVTCHKVITFIDTVTLTSTINIDDAFDVVGNCDFNDTLIFTFTEFDYTDTTITYPCDSIGAKPFDMFAYQVVNGDTIPFDLVDGPTFANTCKTEWEIQDPFNACAGTIFGIAGDVYTPEGLGIPNYQFTLQGSGTDPRMSNEEGHYAFPMMPQGGQYKINPYNNNDVTNGVSTLDLILIQRHILGISTFENPYQYIAADINNSQSLTSTDLLVLRKVILGIYEEFPDNTSWRAFDAAYEFVDPTNPLAEELPEDYLISSLESDMDVDFIGVKVGDVNASYDLGLTEGLSSETRSNSNVELFLERGAGSTFNAVANEALDIAGMQFTINMAGAEITDIYSPYFTPGQIAWVRTASGKYNVSISNYATIEFAKEDVLFTIETECGDCEHLIPSLDYSGNLKAEAYVNSAIEIADLSIEYRDQNSQQQFYVTQNKPNPWADATEISISSIGHNVADMRVFDINGRLVYNISLKLRDGINVVQINDDMIPHSGIFYYEIVSGKQKAQFKMIKLR